MAVATAAVPGVAVVVIIEVMVVMVNKIMHLIVIGASPEMDPVAVATQCVAADAVW